MAKTYKDRLTGDEVQIMNEESNFYTLNDGVKIKKDTFSKKYEVSDEIDPNEFLNPTSALEQMASDLKNMDTSKISNTPQNATRIKYQPPTTLSDSSRNEPVLNNTADSDIKISEAKKQQMIEEYNMKMELGEVGVKPPPFIEDDDKSYIEYEMPNPGEGSLKQTNAPTPQQNNNHQPITQPQIDPLQMMFKMFKNNYDVKINLNIEEKIAEPTFIGMIMENVEGDAIEYYTKIILDKLLKNPLKLKKEIYDQLELEVYGIEYVEEKKREEDEKKREEDEKKNEKENVKEETDKPQ